LETRARVGCSGWEYKHWRGDFYPVDVPKARWFDHYAARFDTVEINNTFYRLPEQSTFAAWAARAPSGFAFAIKASRFLTHMKKLKDPEEPLARLFSRMRPLRQHLGPVLYQLPPGWKLDRERLEHFLQALPKGVRHVLEFRDPSWYADDVKVMLARHGVTVPPRHARFGHGSGYGPWTIDDPIPPLARAFYDRLEAPKEITEETGSHVLREVASFRRVVRLRQPEPAYRHALRFEPWIDLLQRPEAPHEQRPADQQDDRNRELADDERAPRTCALPAAN